ncbi:hypothetical protein ACFVIM_04745 [Streptomyces sp. NPDC057638]|uniref:hypothetical protein n=1 Tax=Streptomyces sp. NPDC057638 TaxID=3346190 RepID=UPI0036A13C9B
MFGGIEEVRWAALEHAYGPAVDVPELLYGLASPDPAEREAALDGMYAAVHHQGDVYDSTLACIPFLLELVGDPSVQDRGGVVELLTSIGCIDLDGDDELDPDDEEFEYAANYAMAASAVTAGADVFLALIDSEDRGVRLAVPLALATLHGEPELVLGLLRERLKVERDPEVRLACVEAGGRIALRHAWLAPEVVEWLVELAQLPFGAFGAGAPALPRGQGEPAPGLRYERGGPAPARPYGQGEPAPDLPYEPYEPYGPYERHEPHEQRGTAPTPRLTPGTPLPYDTAEPPPCNSYDNGDSHDSYDSYDSRDAADTTAGPFPYRRGAAPAPADPPDAHDAGLRLSALAQLARCAPGTLPDDIVTGVTRLLRELRGERLTAPGRRRDPATPAGRRAPWTGDLLRALHSGLGDRVEDRTALLSDQLRSPDPAQRIDAVRMSSGLLRTWRGEYAELVRLVGEQLQRGEPRLADAAATALGELFGLAAPAADALADYVVAEPGRWVQEWTGGPRMLGSAVAALARSGDARVVPVLGRMLELPEAPQDLGYLLEHLGPAALPLAPALRRRLAETRLDDRLYDLAGPLLSGLTALRASDAMPEVLRVLRGAPAYRREWVVELVLRALVAFGPAARAAVPELRALLERAAVTGPGPGSAVPGAFGAKTAGALWAVEGDAEPILPVLRAALAAPDSGARRSAAAVLGSMGEAAVDAAPALRALLRAADPWTRVDAALALWRITGDPGRSWPVLAAAWEALPFTRVPIAERLAERTPGTREPVATDVTGAGTLLRAELSRRRRHNAIDGGYGSHDIVRDEKLLALCRRALTRERPAS